jgi:hypothetical protein
MSCEILKPTVRTSKEIFGGGGHEMTSFAYVTRETKMAGQDECLHLLAYDVIPHLMAKSQTSGRDVSVSGRGTRRQVPAVPAKVAVTVRLDPRRVQQLQAAAEAENRTLTNYVETALMRDLALRDEASRVIVMHAAPGTSHRIDAADIVRAEGETDGAYAKRQSLLTELWSIPDSD